MNKLLATLGFARKSNNISYGETLIEDIKKNLVFLVVISNDIGNSNKKKIINKCSFYKVEYVECLKKDDISYSISKSRVSAVGIKDLNLAEKFKQNWKEGGFDEKK